MPSPHLLDRRLFLKRLGIGAAAAAFLPDRILTDPYAPLPRELRADPIRVRGRVVAKGRGVGQVAISDGLSVVTTDTDGHYELLADARQSFVQLSLPSGYEIPLQPAGTARLHRPIQPDTRGQMEAGFELAALPAPDDEHAFLLLADPQTQDAREVGLLHGETVPDVQATARAMGDVSLFGVSCGDIMFDDLTLYPEYERAVSRMGIPFLQVVGNHDLEADAPTDETSAATFQRHFGPTYYSFNRGRVHYVVLDDVFWHGAGYIGYLSASQLAWFEADLAHVEPGSLVLVFLHIPVFSSQFLRRGQKKPAVARSVANREALYRLLEPFRAHILSGHTHESEHVFEGGCHEHVNGTVCGAWWTGPICYDGTPNGYGIYEVKGEEIRWRYKATGYGADQQLRLYPRGSDPRFPEEIVANIWNWDPEWRVVWYEAGDRRGSLEPHQGLDPLSVELHTGPELPERRPWVDPMPNRHCFYARPSTEGAEVIVEATDRWNRTFTAALSQALSRASAIQPARAASFSSARHGPARGRGRPARARFKSSSDRSRAAARLA